MAGISFLDLPLEVRNMVYDLILDTDTPTRVTSPTRKRIAKPPPLGANALPCVSKQVYSDVSYLYYSQNQFVVGNGPYHSVKSPNVHALTTFLNRIPRCHINYIKSLRIDVYAALDTSDVLSWQQSSDMPRDLNAFHYDCFAFTPLQIFNIQTIATRIVQRFPGLKEVHLLFNGFLPPGSALDIWDYNHFSTYLSYDEIHRSMVKSITMLLRHSSLEKLWFAVPVYPDADPILVQRYRYDKPKYNIQKLVKGVVWEAMAEQAKYFEAEGVETEENKPWELELVLWDKLFMGTLVRRA